MQPRVSNLLWRRLSLTLALRPPLRFVNDCYCRREPRGNKRACFSHSLLHFSSAASTQPFHGLGAADSAVIVPLLQQALERYKIDSTLIFAGRDAVAASRIGPVICTSWPTWKFNMS